MADKSPHDNHSTKKSGKAVKAKRGERKDKQRAATEMERLMHLRASGAACTWVRSAAPRRRSPPRVAGPDEADRRQQRPGQDPPLP
jgi:hypothetical protein